MLGAKHTLLVLGGQWLARIDFAGHGRRMRVAHRHYCAAPNSASLVTQALLAWKGSTPGVYIDGPTSGSQRDVWLLSSEFWNETLSLPWETALMLNPFELKQALAIEAEACSGISSFASQVVAHKIVDVSSNENSDPSWWVTQIADSQLSSLQQTLQRVGGRLRGATHPAALALSARAKAPIEHSTEHSTEHSSEQSLESSLAATLADVAAVEALEPATSDQLPILTYLDQLASAFIRLSVARSDFSCFLNSATNAGAGHGTSWLQLGLAGAVLLAACADYRYCASRWQATQAQLHSQQALRNQHKSTNQELLGVENRIKLLTEQVAQANKRQLQFEQTLVLARAQNQPDSQRWAALLNELAALSSDRWWLESWQADEQTVVLKGWACQSEVVLKLAADLDVRLRRSGWQVLAPKSIEQSTIVRFEIQLQFASAIVDNPIISMAVANVDSQRRQRP